MKRDTVLDDLGKVGRAVLRVTFSPPRLKTRRYTTTVTDRNGTTYQEHVDTARPGVTTASLHLRSWKHLAASARVRLKRGERLDAMIQRGIQDLLNAEAVAALPREPTPQVGSKLGPSKLAAKVLTFARGPKKAAAGPNLQGGAE